MISANHHLEPSTTEKGGKGIMKGKGLSCLVAVALLVGIVGFSMPPAEVQAKPTIKVIFAWPKPDILTCKHLDFQYYSQFLERFCVLEIGCNTGNLSVYMLA